MVEIHVMENGWLVSPPRNEAMGYERANDQCFVFTSWDKLVAHIKRELSLSGPAQSEGDKDCKS
jgi:hypothetical protein